MKIFANIFIFAALTAPILASAIPEMGEAVDVADQGISPNEDPSKLLTGQDDLKKVSWHSRYPISPAKSGSMPGLHRTLQQEWMPLHPVCSRLSLQQCWPRVSMQID